MIRILAILVLLNPAIFIAAQTNLVHNPSLEDTLCCPFTYYDIYCAEHWYQPNPAGSSTDYFHPCNTSYNNWLQLWNMCHPKTGDAYARILLFSSSVDHNREYVCCRLKRPLEAGRCYSVLFWVVAGHWYSSDYTRFGSDRVGIWFSPDSIVTSSADFNVISVTPYIEYNGSPICDEENWIEVRGSFVALGGERHFIIGNFYNNTMTTVAPCNQGNLSPPYISSMILIDDVSVWPCDAPVYKADAGRDKQVCYGDEVILGQNLPDAEYRFLWSTTSHRLTPRDQWDTLATTPYLSVKPEQTTTYYLWVRDFKMDVTCDSVTVFVEPCITPPEIPNVFTPNGDGFNDLFAFKNHELWELETCIRNRWGMVVFQGQNDHWWDGTIHGQPAAEGVYFYTVTARNHFGQHKEFHGVVTLLR
jgi:gliding motility-associated-like protein